VLSCFGDIALAIGRNFVKYLPSTLQMLDQAANTKVSEEDEELVEYLGLLQEGILEAYIGITQALNDGCNSELLLPQLSSIFRFIELVSHENTDESLEKNCIGLVGDLAVAFARHAGEVLPLFEQRFVSDLISKGLHIDNIHEIACWTKNKCDELVCQGGR
jgi:importin subunit beta-1